jgi:hypothetical protein
MPRATEAHPPQDQPAGPQSLYRLTLTDWPVVSGMRFLIDSFCEEHRPEYAHLVENLVPEEFDSAHLEILAGLLLESCGKEPGFARSGPPMKRVRLALLKAGDARLTLAQLADKTGLNAFGLAGKIRQKSKGWLEIVHI